MAPLAVVKSICILALLVVNISMATHAPREGVSCIPTCDIPGTTISEGDKVPDPTNCSRYYICSDGNNDGVFDLSDEPLTCDEGTYFNSNYQECRSIPTDGSAYCTNICNPCDVKCEEPGSLIPDTTNCANYYVCLSDLTPVGVSCDPGEEFDYILSTCVTAGSAKCYDLCDQCVIYCVSEGRLPDPEDCRSYYYCIPPSDLAHFQCSEGEIYNSSSQACTPGDTCNPACLTESSTSSSSLATGPTDSITTVRITDPSTSVHDYEQEHE